MSSIECPTQFVGRAVCGRQQQTLQGYEKNYGVSITVPREAICGHKTISITGRRSKEVVAAIRNEIARLQHNATKSADWKRNQRQRAKMLRGPKVPDHQQHVVKVAATVNPFAGFDVEEEQEPVINTESTTKDLTSLFFIKGTEDAPTIRELKRQNWERKQAYQKSLENAEHNNTDDWYLPNDNTEDAGETELIDYANVAWDEDM